MDAPMMMIPFSILLLSTMNLTVRACEFISSSSYSSSSSFSCSSRCPSRCSLVRISQMSDLVLLW